LKRPVPEITTNLKDAYLDALHGSKTKFWCDKICSGKEIVDEWIAVQDKTTFFFIPRMYAPKDNALERIVLNKAGEEDVLRTVPIARLFLGNFPHIKAYWIQMGFPSAMKFLHAGDSDLDGSHHGRTRA